MARQPLILWGCLVASLGLAPQQALAGKKATELIQSKTEIPDERLFDVGIRVFSPGFPENPEALRTMEEKGVFTAVRRSEARYFPVQMMQTLQSSGFWGAVRVIPDMHFAPLLVMFDGEVTRLNGTVEAQYAGWRELLWKIFMSETGLPLNPNLEIVKEARASKNH